MSAMYRNNYVHRVSPFFAIMLISSATMPVMPTKDDTPLPRRDGGRRKRKRAEVVAKEIELEKASKVMKRETKVSVKSDANRPKQYECMLYLPLIDT